MSTKTVGRRQAASRGRHEKAQAKVTENARRVEALSDQPSTHLLLVPSRTGKPYRLHRLTCKRALQNPSVAQTKDFHKADREAASCCKPVIPPAPPAATPPHAMTAEERVRRVDAAKAESAALSEWHHNGQKGAKPATPNLDAVQAEHDSGIKPRKAKATTTAIRRPRSVRYQEAMARKKAGARGKGKAVTDVELDAYVAKVLAEHPEADRNEWLEIAYWLDQLALSRSRWYAAWDRVRGRKAA